MKFARKFRFLKDNEVIFIYIIKKPTMNKTGKV